jgi:phage gp36-like protein
VTVYATAADLEKYAAGSSAFASMPSDTVNAALSAASALADEYLAQRFTLPLTAWSDKLRSAVCALAAHELFGVRGYNPELGPDEVIRQRHDDALRWLREVRDGDAAGIGLTDSTPAETETRHVVVVTSRPRRGW